MKSIAVQAEGDAIFFFMLHIFIHDTLLATSVALAIKRNGCKGKETFKKMLQQNYSVFRCNDIVIFNLTTDVSRISSDQIAISYKNHIRISFITARGAFNKKNSCFTLAFCI